MMLVILMILAVLVICLAARNAPQSLVVNGSLGNGWLRGAHHQRQRHNSGAQGGLMGFTSGLGTCAAALLLALAATSASVQAANPGVTLDIAVSGLRSLHGNVLVCLTANPKFFPNCEKDPAGRKQRVAATQAGDIRFEGVPPQTYAISLIHDENANNKMDLAIFMPKEGFGFSRNPRIGMGPPKFASAAFIVGAKDEHLAVVMKYMF